MAEQHQDRQLMMSLASASPEPMSAPPEVVAAAKGVYTWRTIDAELAALAHDSLLEDAGSTLRRADAATERLLTFQATGFSVELGVTAAALVGQLLPAEPGTMTLRTPEGVMDAFPVDDVGRFTVRPLPTGAFSLHARTASGAEFVTAWATL